MTATRNGVGRPLPEHPGAIAYDVFAQWLLDQDEKDHEIVQDD